MAKHTHTLNLNEVVIVLELLTAAIKKLSKQNAEMNFLFFILFFIFIFIFGGATCVRLPFVNNLEDLSYFNDEYNGPFFIIIILFYFILEGGLARRTNTT